MRHSSALRSGAAVAAAGLILTGCSLGDSSSGDVSAGSLAEDVDLEGLEVTVGGKEFTAQLILCEMAAQTLESAGATVDRQCGMTGSDTVRSALTSGEIDLYWEFTGTAWISFLQETEAIEDPQELYEAVRDRDAENGITWLEPGPANDTYAVAASSEKAEELGVETLSDYAELAKEGSEDASFCGAAEFFARDDGWPGVQERYGFELPSNLTSEVALGVIYDSVDKADPCVFGEVFATDGRIDALDLQVLEDDQNFFMPYNPSVNVRTEVLEENPDIEKLFGPLTESIDDDTLRELNGRVDIDGDTPEDAVNDWLVEEGFIGD